MQDRSNRRFAARLGLVEHMAQLTELCRGAGGTQHMADRRIERRQPNGILLVNDQVAECRRDMLGVFEL